MQSRHAPMQGKTITQDREHEIMRIELDQEAAVLRFSGALTIQTIEQAYSTLCGFHPAPLPNAIDLALVDACDASGVQLIVALGKSIALQGSTMRIHKTSPVFDATAASTGVYFNTFENATN